jgi:hypothetical protein
MFGNNGRIPRSLWVTYNELLGVRSLSLLPRRRTDFSGFIELERLPYLTMTPMKEGCRCYWQRVKIQ